MGEIPEGPKKYSRRSVMGGIVGLAGLAVVGTGDTHSTSTRGRGTNPAPESGSNGSDEDKREVYTSHDIAEIQQRIFSSEGEVLIVVDSDLNIPEGYQGFNVKPFSAENEVNEGENDLRKALLYIPEGKKVLIFGGSWNTHGFAYSVYSQRADLTMDHANFSKGSASLEQLPREENAYVFANGGSLNLKNCEIDGSLDEVGSAPFVIDGETDGYTQKGLCGVYGVNSKMKISNCVFKNQSWDSITVNGGTLNLEDSLIEGTNPEIGAGAGLGVINGAKVDVNRCQINGRIKSVLCFGESRIRMRETNIHAGSELYYNCEGVVGFGVVEMEKCNLYSDSNCVALYNPESKVSKCRLFVGMDPDYVTKINNGELGFEQAFDETAWIGDSSRINGSCQFTDNKVHVAEEYKDYLKLACDFYGDEFKRSGNQIFVLSNLQDEYEKAILNG